MRRPTIYDIAREAKVSPTTVSRAFNNESLVSREKLEQIYEVSERLGYRPHMIARSLRTKKTGFLGLVLPDIVNPFFSELTRGVEDVARQNGYHVLLGNAESDYARQAWYLEMFWEKGIEGVILSGITGGPKDEDSYRRLQERGIPCVLIDRYVKSPDIPFVGSDNFGGGYKAGKHLLELGHRRIGAVTGPLEIELWRDRVAGFQKALQEGGVSLEESLILESDCTARGGYHSMEMILGMSEKPTAAFIMSDGMAIGALALLKTRKVRIPEEMAIVGFDDVSVASLLDPPLTTLAQKKYEMGARAAEVLIDSIRKKTMPRIQTILDVELIVRNSTVKDAVRDITLTKYGYAINRA